MTVKKISHFSKFQINKRIISANFMFITFVGSSRASLKNDNGFLYTWKESDSQKGSNESN